MKVQFTQIIRASGDLVDIWRKIKLETSLKIFFCLQAARNVAHLFRKEGGIGRQFKRKKYGR